MAMASLPDEVANGATEEAEAQVVTPWEVEAKDGGKINYDKLIVDFGCSKMDTAMVSRVERLTGRPAHPFLRRNVFFAHRDSTKSSTRTKRGRNFTFTPVEDLLQSLCISDTSSPSCSPSKHLLIKACF